MKTVSIIGLGYIGLPSACLLANSGFNVHGVDIDLKKIKKLEHCQTPFHEPKLDSYLKKAMNSGLISFSNKPEASDVFLICVPTPISKKNKKIFPDISYVINAIESIKVVLKKGDLIIIESTCPIGTTLKVYEQLKKYDEELSKNIFISYCPEEFYQGMYLRS